MLTQIMNRPIESIVIAIIIMVAVAYRETTGTGLATNSRWGKDLHGNIGAKLKIVSLRQSRRLLENIIDVVPAEDGKSE